MCLDTHMAGAFEASGSIFLGIVCRNYFYLPFFGTIAAREGETIEGSRTTRNRPYPVLKCSSTYSVLVCTRRAAPKKKLKNAKVGRSETNQSGKSRTFP